MKDLSSSKSYLTQGGIEVHRTRTPLPLADSIEPIIDALDERPGVLLASSYEYPGRYTRWDIGFIDPPIRVVSRDRFFTISALNDRGKVLLPAIVSSVRGLEAASDVEADDNQITGKVRPPYKHFSEEQRSKQVSVFSILRGLIDLFSHAEEPYLGLYGAFGYDLAFQFEPIEFKLDRPPDKRDLVLYLPDQLVIVDHHRQTAVRYAYDFRVDGASTPDLPRTGSTARYRGRAEVAKSRDHKPGEFADLVRVAHEWFKRGDLFEVVPGQVFYELCPSPPSEIFRRLRERNPAPYSTLMNLCEAEYLVGASPEMYLRSEGRQIETCPISGTIARGEDAISDAEQILKLLSSQKETSELTMCTDVDRNDKSRVCEPGSIRVIGRRQIEMYSKVIHTVDHVEGVLREGFDALDAFLSHTWAVTVTGAPKLWAMRFIEEHERTYRAWYGGAIGFISFDGNINTGLTLRTIRIKDGVAEIRAGGTLLIDSDPESEERETELKASAFIDVIRRPRGASAISSSISMSPAKQKHIFLIDFEDSFVNTLADYLRQTGAEVLTVRAGMSQEELRMRLASYKADLVLLSPGPGSPSDFDVSGKIDVALRLGLPIFGVCLGLQGMVEYFGGELGVLSYPMHGKASLIKVLGGRIFRGLPGTFTAGRYHSLYAIKEKVPPVLEITAESDDGVVMAIEHKYLPLAAVQFHPESIMTLKEKVGIRMIHNVLTALTDESRSVEVANAGIRS